MLIEQGTEPDANRTKLYDQVFDLLLDGQAPTQPPTHRRQARRPPGAPPPRLRDDPRQPRRRVRREARSTGSIKQEFGAAPRQPLRVRAPLAPQPSSRSSTTSPNANRHPRRARRSRNRVAVLAPHLPRSSSPPRRWRERHQERAARTRSSPMPSEIAGDESRWAEPYALLTGLGRRARRPGQSTWWPRTPPSGCALLATAQTLGDGTIVEVLDLSDEVARAGGGLRLSLPDKLDEPAPHPRPSRSPPPTDTQRQRSLPPRPAVATEVGQRWPVASATGRGAAAFASTTTSRHHHQDLFETVETRDGRVQRCGARLPAGRFLMGSPENEEGPGRRRGAST